VTSNPAVAELLIAAAIAVTLLILAPGVAVVGMVGLLVLTAYGVTVAVGRRRARSSPPSRRRGRPPAGARRRPR
jgi:hypothetical protein